MGQILGKVTADDGRPRGPDVSFRIEVPPAWLVEGAKITVKVPRQLSCARCGGGGCDVCSRSGAFAMRSASDEPEVLEVTLPATEETTGVVLRIPKAGPPPAPPAEGEEPLARGHLLLRVHVGAEPSAGVDRSYGVQTLADLKEEDRRRLIRSSVLMIVALIVLFGFLLRFSGWL